MQISVNVTSNVRVMYKMSAFQNITYVHNKILDIGIPFTLIVRQKLIKLEHKNAIILSEKF